MTIMTPPQTNPQQLNPFKIPLSANKNKLSQSIKKNSSSLFQRIAFKKREGKSKKRTYNEITFSLSASSQNPQDSVTLHRSPKRRLFNLPIPSTSQAKLIKLNFPLVSESVKPLNRFFRKKPEIDLIEGHQVLKFNGQVISMRLLNMGKKHKVYELAAPQMVRIGSTWHKPSDLIMKVAGHNNVGKDKIKKLFTSCVQGLDYLRKRNIATPNIILDPREIEDTANPNNGGFWLIEKMEESVVLDWDAQVSFQELSPKSQRLLFFVKKHLTESSKVKKFIIDNFFPRNVMWNKEAIPCIVGFSKPDDDVDLWEWEYETFSKLIAWSNGNANLFPWLITDFEAEAKVTMQRKLTEAIKEKGCFPLPKN